MRLLWVAALAALIAWAGPAGAQRSDSDPSALLPPLGCLPTTIEPDQTLTGTVEWRVATQLPMDWLSVFVDRRKLYAVAPNATAYTYRLDTNKLPNGPHTLTWLAHGHNLQRCWGGPIPVVVANVGSQALGVRIAGPGGSPGEDDRSVTFENAQGYWTIFKGCFGPAAHGGSDVTVGPGYVARLVLRDGTVVTDDEHRAGGLNQPGNGGIGAFGFHDARKTGSAFDPGAAWPIDGRRCAHDDWGRLPGGGLGSVDSGIGVVGARLVDPPTVAILPDGSAEGRVTIDVGFADNRMLDGSPMLVVRYRYAITRERVDAQLTVIELCPFGRCGWGRAFLKEPKLVAAVTGGGYTRMSVLDAGGAVAANRLEGNHDGSWLSPACLWAGGSPKLHTAQCDDPARAAARFDFGGYGSGGGRCDNQGCLLVRMVAAPSALRTAAASGASAEALWQNARTGLDGWAIASAARQRYAPQDSAVDGVRWGCKGPSVASPPNTSSPILRRWELVGGARSATGGYAAASVLFNGWEGGRGYDDCEPDSRTFGPKGESWTQHATYTVAAGAAG